MCNYETIATRNSLVCRIIQSHKEGNKQHTNPQTTHFQVCDCCVWGSMETHFYNIKILKGSTIEEMCSWSKTHSFFSKKICCIFKPTSIYFIITSYSYLWNNYNQKARAKKIDISKNPTGSIKIYICLEKSKLSKKVSNL